MLVKMDIRFGPAGLGGKEVALEMLNEFASQGIKACEVSFTYGAYFNEEFAEKLRNLASKLDVRLSIHAPYYINLNSKEIDKIDASKKRILDCCSIGHFLSFNGAKTPIVFHPGFYGDNREKAYVNIKNNILDLLDEVRRNNWNVTLCPEIMGKKNVFGSIEEISKLVRETGCGFCIDFAHILARYNEDNFEVIKKEFSKYEDWHCHFSGIVYGEKGEQKHKDTEEREWRKLLSFLKKLKKNITVISESPNPFEDSILGKEIYKVLN